MAFGIKEKSTFNSDFMPFTPTSSAHATFHQFLNTRAQLSHLHPHEMQWATVKLIAIVMKLKWNRLNEENVIKRLDSFTQTFLFRCTKSINRKPNCVCVLSSYTFCFFFLSLFVSGGFHSFLVFFVCLSLCIALFVVQLVLIVLRAHRVTRPLMKCAIGNVFCSLSVCVD